LALLSHSGSRGLGANIAKYYTNVAKRLRKLDPTVSNLAWLMMDESEGMEYWEAMNLAGDYAKACHDNIHMLIGKALKERPLAKIENHHNFAWKEVHDGKDLIVHRKGATPAGNGVLGIIPGSMATPGFIVEGLGNIDSLISASHGAGRAMSRTQAKQSFAWSHVKNDLETKHIKLMGGGVDEAMGAYKDIYTVMSYQSELVNVLASFMPKIVKMAGSDEEPED
jgi:tRNA-splicing ligase RtcB